MDSREHAGTYQMYRTSGSPFLNVELIQFPKVFLVKSLKFARCSFSGKHQVFNVIINLFQNFESKGSMYKDLLYLDYFNWQLQS